MDEATLIVVSLPKLKAPGSLYTLFDEMCVVSIEHIPDQLALTGLPDKGYPLSTSGLYPGFKIRFGSKNEGQRSTHLSNTLQFDEIYHIPF